MLNVRLEEGVNEQLSKYSNQYRSSKSSIVKEALAMYFDKEQSQQSPYMLGSDLFGVSKSIETDISRSYKSKLKTKLREKYSH